VVLAQLRGDQILMAKGAATRRNEKKGCIQFFVFVRWQRFEVCDYFLVLYVFIVAGEAGSGIGRAGGGGFGRDTDYDARVRPSAGRYPRHRGGPMAGRGGGGFERF